MIYFYTALTIISAVLFTTDLVLMYMEKIKSFGLEKKLFKFKGKTIPVEAFLPENLTMVFAFFIVLGTAGIFLYLIGFQWYLSLPFSVMTSMIVCFAFQYPFRLAMNSIKNKTLPKGDAASGIEGYASAEIDGDGYGTVTFEYNDVEFTANAMSANQTPIPKFERVIILTEENGFYFVESITEVFNPLNEPEEI